MPRTLGLESHDQLIIMTTHSVVMHVLDGTISPTYRFNDNWCIVLLHDGRLAEVRRVSLETIDRAAGRCHSATS